MNPRWEFQNFVPVKEPYSTELATMDDNKEVSLIIRSKRADVVIDGVFFGTVKGTIKITSKRGKPRSVWVYPILETWVLSAHAPDRRAPLIIRGFAGIQGYTATTQLVSAINFSLARNREDIDSEFVLLDSLWWRQTAVKNIGSVVRAAAHAFVTPMLLNMPYMAALNIIVSDWTYALDAVCGGFVIDFIDATGIAATMFLPYAFIPVPGSQFGLQVALEFHTPLTGINITPEFGATVPGLTMRWEAVPLDRCSYGCFRRFSLDHTSQAGGGVAM